MTRRRRHICCWLIFGLLLWVSVVGTAAATQIFPAAEIQEAHTLRQRILAEIPQLVPKRLQGQVRLSEETIALTQQRLTALQAREGENPFFHWAQGELTRHGQGAVAAASFFERARQAAGQRVVIHWLLWQDYLRGNLQDEAQREERALQAIQVTWGLSRFPLLAAEQMPLATEVADGGDLPRAAALYEAAAANVPESPEALMDLATLTWQMDKSRLFSIIREVASAAFQILFSPRAGFRLRSNLVLSFLVTWLVMVCLVAAILSIKTQPLFAHDLNEGFLKGFPPPTRVSLGLLIFVLPLLLGLGILWAAIMALLISGPYLSRREQGMVSILLVGLAVLPLGYHGVAARHALASSHEFALAQVVDQGGRGEALVQDLHRWITEAPQAGLPRYYLGLVLKRRGELPQAEVEMTEAAQLLPRAGFVQVGLGNVRYLQGHLQEAEAAYRRASEIMPSSAAAQMNLSRLYVQRLQLDQSNEALTRSRSLDPHMVRTVLSFQSQGPAQLVVDEAVPWNDLAAGLAPRIGDVGAIADGLWGGLLRGVSLDLLPYVAVLLLIVFWVHAGLRERTMPARRCEQCGTPFCTKCRPNPKEKEYCGPCAAVFRQRDGVAAFVRVRRLREVEEWMRKERMRTRALGSVLPGGSDLYTGRVTIGLLLFVPAVWLLIEGIVLDILTPSLRFSPSLPAPLRATVVLVLLAILYAYSVRRSWRRASRVLR